MIVSSILAPASTLAEQDDRTFFSDSRRSHRLRREGVSVIASSRDGRAFRLPWPAREPVPGHEAFAAHIFSICEKTAAEREPGGLS